MLKDFFSNNCPEIKNYNVSLGESLFNFNIPKDYIFENKRWDIAFALYDELKTFAKFLNPSIKNQKSHSDYKHLSYYYIQNPINFNAIETAVSYNNVFSIKKEIYDEADIFLNENNLQNYDVIHYVPSFRVGYKKNTLNDHKNLLDKACSLIQTEKLLVASSETWVIDYVKNK
ncbi:uncharacterized protein METZ01_LOCUS340456, partial [marine metagenome]